MWVWFEDTVGFGVRFKNPPEYWIGTCTGNNTYIPFTLPVKKEKLVWTFRKHEDTLELRCDGVEIFNFNYESSTFPGPACKNNWSKYFTYLEFKKTDNASDYYRSDPGGKRLRELMSICRIFTFLWCTVGTDSILV